MRPGATPVPIPNTMVKTRTADGTALETVWESRWPPNLKKRKHKYWYGRTTIRRANPISRAVLLTLGLPVIRVQKKFWVLMTDKQSVRSRCEALRPSVLSLMALHANACKNKPAYESKLSTQDCFYSRSHLYVPWKLHTEKNQWYKILYILYKTSEVMLFNNINNTVWRKQT